MIIYEEKLSLEAFAQKYCDIYSFQRLSHSHLLERTISLESQTAWLLIIDIDQYDTSLLCQVFSCVAQA